MLNFPKIKKATLSLIIISSFLLTLPASAFNFKDSFSTKGSLGVFSKQAGFSPQPATIESYVGLVLTTIFSILGIVSVVLIIYSGFVWMTARGNESQVAKAKDNLYNIIIGLMFIIGAYALTTFLLKIFT